MFHVKVCRTFGLTLLSSNVSVTIVLFEMAIHGLHDSFYQDPD